MGAIYAPVTIRNPAEPNREWKGEFLVDTGAIDTLAPRPQLEAIGLKPKGREFYELADGTRLEMETTTCDVEMMGKTVGTTVIFGEAGVEPLLGMTVLESAGIRIDPSDQTLHRLPGLRLPGLRL